MRGAHLALKRVGFLFMIHVYNKNIWTLKMFGAFFWVRQHVDFSNWVASALWRAAKPKPFDDYCPFLMD